MATPRAIVLRAAGTNCDRETEAALAAAGALVDRVHVARLREAPGLLDGYQLLALPGGFSYGDDLGAGRVLAHELARFLEDALAALLGRGGLVIGICNGFQVLVKAGLLPGGPGAEPSVTLTHNACGRFETRWVHLEASPACRSPWLEPGERIELPIAHGEGRLVARTKGVLDALRASGQAALRYVAPDGGPARGFPENPNGSEDDLAGILDPSGQVLGLMPHPERHIAFHHHPRWTRGGRGEPDGLRVFRRAVRSLGG